MTTRARRSSLSSTPSLQNLWLSIGIALTIVQIAHGADRNVWAWGRNTNGECNVPLDVTNAVTIAGGGYFSVALRSDGTATAWGDNTFGQLNVSSDFTNVVAITCGNNFTVGLRNDGTITKFGYTSASGLPAGLTGIVGIAAGYYGCAVVRSDGTVACYGANNYNQCVVPPSATNVIEIAAGGYHYLALRADGTVVAWGWNAYGQGTAPSTLSNVVTIAAGGYHNMAITADGKVVAWGKNTSGATNVPAGLRATAIAAGGEDGDQTEHSLAVTTNGAVKAWGANQYGQATVPLDLPLAQKVAGGGHHSLALVVPTLAAVPPTILGQPQSQTVVVGSTVYLLVRALGGPPLSYQWFFGTNAIPEGTNAVLKLTNLQTTNSGNYYCVVSNGGGAVPSSLAALSVLPALGINMIPAITLIGDIGATYRLEYVNAIGPTNSWVTVATITITNSPQLYLDASAIGQPARVYRTVQLP